MKGTTPNQIPSQAAGFLRLAGVILFFFALINYILLFVPPNFGDLRWQLNFTTQMVEQGVIPVLAIALMFCAYGLQEVAGLSPEKPKQGFNSLKFWVYVISGILGVMYLVLIPLHVGTTIAASNETIEKINQDAATAQVQLEERLQEQQTQMLAILGNQQRLEDYIQEQQLTEEQLARLQQFQENPEVLGVQSDAIGQELKREIENRRREAEKRSQLGTFKSNLRVGLGSLLLASCYLTIAWSGLMNKRSRKKAV
ncbi:MAG: HpsJ family protein [Arthrospira sp. SH-MAG29]|nr:HpsJ family protein [Arthrospira sp. SH-MAG29]MBS0016841.1 HpsJ family protein [Arthrospira sp. SH-MAG29]